MSAYMVKTAEGDRLVDGVEGLRELVLSGEITEETLVRRGQRGKWVEAREVGALVTAFSEVAEGGISVADQDDPWAAWDDDLDDDEDVIDEVTGHGAFLAPDIAIEDEDTHDSEVDAFPSIEVSVDDIVGEAPKLAGPALPPVTPVPLEPPDLAVDIDGPGPRFVVDSKPQTPTRVPRLKPPAPDGGQVLSFPPGGRRKTRPVRSSAVPKPAPATAAAPGPMAQVLDRVPPKRFYLYGGLILATLLAVGVARWWVWSLATWSSADPLGHSLGAEPPARLAGDPVVEPVEVEPVAVVAVAGDTLSPVLDELKATMSHDVFDLPAGETAGFEDALFLELNRLVRVKSIDFEVLAWDDETQLPGAIAVTVEVRSQGDPSRELGAVALNLGKYIGHYDFIVRKLDVELIDEEGTARKTSLDPGLAVRLYNDEIGMIQALGLE